MASTAPTSPAELRRVIVASSVGTVIEWYDFYLFAALSAEIGKIFFVGDDPTVQLLKSLAIFATGFVVRPFGALVFGRLGDIVGRKATFILTLGLMGGSTFLVGVLPTYAQVGMLAPVLLLILRMLQGLALGGEYGGAATYVAEHAPANQRGYYTSFIQITATAGLILSLIVIQLCRKSFGADFEVWGWRIPFLISAVLIAVSFSIRLRMHESPLFNRVKESGQVSKNPLRDSFVNPENRRLVLIALFGAAAGQGVIWYTAQFYVKTFMETTLKLNKDMVSNLLIVTLLLATPLFVYFGALSDRIGRKKLMMASCAASVVAFPALFWLITNAAKDPANPNQLLIGLSVFLLVVPVTMIYGPIAAFLVELFPVRVRYTSMSLPYHIGNGVFGGFVPLIATWLPASTGNPLAGLIYPCAIALVTLFIGLKYLPANTHQNQDMVEGPAA
ncbi:MAG: MHS family MFS transporter [Chthonomonas sp.]|nr:MHS family MFS transporter [Chthonomonas sp.]